MSTAAGVSIDSKSKSSGVSRSDLATARSPWILGRWQDLLLIVGSPLLIYLGLTGARRIWTAAAISSFVMIWAIGHYLPTMMRAYGDNDLFAKFRLRLILAPILLIAVCSFSYATSLRGVMALTAMWGWWHYLMQAHGFVRIYDAKVGSFGVVTRWLDFAMCVVWFGAAVILNDNALHGVLIKLYDAGITPPPASIAATVKSVTLVLVATVTVAFVVHTTATWIRGDRVNPIKPLLMLTTFGCFWYTTSTVANLVIAYAFFELFHDTQYLAIVWAFNRNRVNRDSNLGGFTRFLFRPRFGLIVLYLLIIGSFGSLDLGSKLISAGKMQDVLFGVFMAAALLHYYFDGFIWKLRDVATRESFDIEGKGDSVRPFIPPWLRHGLLWSLFVVPLAIMTVAQVSRRMVTRDQLQAARQNIVRDYETLAAWAPNSFRARYDVGLALESNNNLDGAIEHYRESLQLVPDFTDSRDALRRALQRKGKESMDQGDTQLAQKYFQESLAFTTDQPQGTTPLYRSHRLP